MSSSVPDNYQELAKRIVRLLDGNVFEQASTEEWVEKQRTLQGNVRDDILTTEYGLVQDEEKNRDLWVLWQEIKALVLDQHARMQVYCESDNRKQQLQEIGKKISHEAKSQGFIRSDDDSDGNYQLDQFLNAGTAQFRKLSQVWTQSGDGQDSVDFTSLLGNVVDLSDDEQYRLFCKIDADDDGSQTWSEYLAYLYREIIFSCKFVDKTNEFSNFSNKNDKSGSDHHTIFVEEDQSTRHISNESRVTVRSITPIGTIGYNDFASTAIMSCSDNSLLLWNMSTFSNSGMINTSGLATLAQEYYYNIVNNNNANNNTNNIIADTHRNTTSRNSHMPYSNHHRRLNTRLLEKLMPSKISLSTLDVVSQQPLLDSNHTNHANSQRVHMAETHRHIVSGSKKDSLKRSKKKHTPIRLEDDLYEQALKMAQTKYFGRAADKNELNNTSSGNNDNTSQANNSMQQSIDQHLGKQKYKISSRNFLAHTAVCWHSVHRKLIVAGADRFIYVFKHDSQLGFVLCDIFFTQTASIVCVAPVHNALAVGTSTGTVIQYSIDREGQKQGIWEEGVLGVATPRWQSSLYGQVLGTIQGTASNAVKKIQYMPHLGIVFAQSCGVYNVALNNLQLVHKIVGQQEQNSEVGIQCFALSRRSIFVAADLAIVICDSANNSSSKSFFLPYNGFGKVIHLIVIESSNQLVVISDDKKVRQYDQKTNHLIQTLTDTLVYAPINVYTSAAYDTFSQRLVTGGCALKSWRLVSNRNNSTHEAAVVYTGYSKEFNQMITVSADKSVNLWSLRTLKSLQYYEVQFEQPGFIGDVTITGACTDIKGRKLLLTTQNSKNESTLHIWNLNSGLFLGELTKISGEITNCICLPAQEPIIFAANVEAGVHRVSFDESIPPSLHCAEEANTMAAAGNQQLTASGNIVSVWFSESGRILFKVAIGQATSTVTSLAVVYTNTNKITVCTTYDHQLSFFLVKASAGVVSFKNAFHGFCSRLAVLSYDHTTDKWSGYGADHKSQNLDAQQPFQVPDAYKTKNEDSMYQLVVSDNICSMYLVDQKAIESLLTSNASVFPLVFDCSCPYLQLIRSCSPTGSGIVMSISPVPPLGCFILGCSTGEVVILTYHGKKYITMSSEYGEESAMTAKQTSQLEQPVKPFDNQLTMNILCETRHGFKIMSPYDNDVQHLICRNCLYLKQESAEVCICGYVEDSTISIANFEDEDTTFYITEHNSTNNTSNNTNVCQCFQPNIQSVKEPEYAMYCDIVTTSVNIASHLSTAATKQKIQNEIEKTLYNDGVYTQPEYKMLLRSSRYDISVPSMNHHTHMKPPLQSANNASSVNNNPIDSKHNNTGDSITLHWPQALQRNLPTLSKITRYSEQDQDIQEQPTIEAHGAAPQNILQQLNNISTTHHSLPKTDK